MQKLDLHGMAHEDAEWAVIKFLEDNYNSDEEVEILTGNSNAMRNIVREITTQYGLCCKVGQFNSPCYGIMRVQM